MLFETGGSSGGGEAPEAAAEAPAQSQEAPEWATRLEGRFDELSQMVTPQAPEHEIDDGQGGPFDGLSDEELANLSDQELAELLGFEMPEGLEEETDESRQEKAAALLDARINQAIQVGLRQNLGPHLQAQEEQRRDAEAEAVEAAYPELQDEDTARRVLQAAEQRAQAYGQPDLALEPGFVEETYLAMKAREMSEAEVPASSRMGSRLEGGGGAAPGAEDSDDDITSAIVAAHKRITV